MSEPAVLFDPDAGRDPNGRDSAERHEVGDAKRSIHRPHRPLCRHPRLPLLHRRIHVLQVLFQYKVIKFLHRNLLINLLPLAQ